MPRLMVASSRSASTVSWCFRFVSTTPTRRRVESVRDGHDEFWKFLGPYGWSKGYMGADGKPAPPGLIPTLEESMEQKIWVVGDADEVAETIGFYSEQLGGIENLMLFPAMPGDPYTKVEEQLHRLSEDVLPKL